jgi:hypothetical protein
VIASASLASRRVPRETHAGLGQERKAPLFCPSSLLSDARDPGRKRREGGMRTDRCRCASHDDSSPPSSPRSLSREREKQRNPGEGTDGRPRTSDRGSAGTFDRFEFSSATNLLAAGWHGAWSRHGTYKGWQGWPATSLEISVRMGSERHDSAEPRSCPIFSILEKLKLVAPCCHRLSSLSFVSLFSNNLFLFFCQP